MRNALRKLWDLLHSYERRDFFLLLLFMVFNGLVEMLTIATVPIYVALVTGDRLQGDFGDVLRYFRLDELTTNQIIIYGGLVLLAVYVFRFGVATLNTYFMQRYVRNREYRFSTGLFQRYLQAPLTFHLQMNSAELIRNMQTEIQAMTQGFFLPIMKALSQMFIVPLIIGTLLYVNPVVTIISFLVIGAGIALYDGLLKSRLRKFGRRMQAERGRMIKEITQGLGGIKELKILRRMPFFLKRYQETTRRYLRAKIFALVAGQINNKYLELISVAGLLLIIALLIVTGTPSAQIAPIVALFTVAMIRMRQSLNVLLGTITSMRTNYVTVFPIYEGLKGMSTEPIQIEESGKLTFEREICFEKVTYSYPNTQEDALKDIEFCIRKEESIGLVGSTGAGKTTLVDVLLGLLEPREGQITVDGTPIYKDLVAWHKLIGYIPQQIFLLDDNIRQNVAFGLPREEIDEERVWKALESAQLAEFIRELPDGIETITGERGVRLSGGQQQRIGIARALYHNPPVLVLDEATSSLDNKTEKMFMEALAKLRQGHTLVTIAHRLTTIENCDRIIVLHKGRIVDIGTYRQLLERNEVFREMAL